MTEEELLTLLVGLFGTVTSSFLFNITESSYLDVIFKAGNSGANELALGVDMLPATPSISNYLDQMLSESSVNISNTFKKDFNKILEKSKGGTKKELESKISKMFDRYKTGDKIEQIAETEASATANFARLEVVQQYNVPVKKEWLTQMDDKVRDSHLIDGQLRELADLFDLTDGEKALYPGDPNLPAQDRINERCFLTYNNNGVSYAGVTPEDRDSYWLKQRSEIEVYKNIIKESYKKAFEDIEQKINKLIKEV